jgi:uncharacterized protein (TIGR03435 family)
VLRSTILLAFVALFATGTAIGQTAGTRPGFEVAVVKLNKTGDTAGAGVLPGGQVTIRNRTLLDLIRLAYNVAPDGISGGPGWLEDDRYDVVAKAPPNPTLGTVRPLLQTLLADYFKLTVHWEQSPTDAFALVAEKGGPRQLKPAESAHTDCRRSALEGTVRVSCTNIGMKDLAVSLKSWAPGYIDRPVADLTNIPGNYDFDLTWMLPDAIADQGGFTVFEALRQQLGLKLEPRKLPLPVLAIDQAERLAGQ